MVISYQLSVSQNFKRESVPFRGNRGETSIINDFLPCKGNRGAVKHERPQDI